MNSLQLKWGEAFLLTLPCIALYMLTFFTLCTLMFGIENIPNWNTWVLVYFCGAFLHQYTVVMAGQRAKQQFWNTPLPKIFEGGVYPTPNIAHFTLYIINTPLLWGMYLVDTHGERTEHHEKVSEVQYDQLRTSHNANVQMSLPVSVTSRITENILFWFTGFRKGESHLIAQRFGFRVMMLAYICAGIATTGNMISQKYNEGLRATRSFFGVNQQHSETIQVTVHLKVGTSPVMPPQKYFEVKEETESEQPFSVPGDSRLYYPYIEPPAGQIRGLIVRSSRCILVPPEKEVAFQSIIPPTNAVNVRKEVRYSTKGDIRRRTTYWANLRNSWDTVDNEVGYIVVTGLSLSQLGGAPGGLVCF